MTMTGELCVRLVVFAIVLDTMTGEGSRNSSQGIENWGFAVAAKNEERPQQAGGEDWLKMQEMKMQMDHVTAGRGVQVHHDRWYHLTNHYDFLGHWCVFRAHERRYQSGDSGGTILSSSGLNVV